MERYHSSRLRNFLLFTGAFALGIFALGCSDKGVEPNAAPKDYKVYFSSETAGSPMLFAFHTGTLAIDSAYIPWGSLRGVTVSADGGRLYIDNGTTVHVVDAGTLSPIAELPYQSWSPVAVSRDNRLVAITGRDLTILRTSDYSVVFSDTDNTRHGVFSSDNKTFFCVADSSSHGPRVVYSVDLSRHPYRVTHKSFSDGSVIQVVPSHDQSKWFLYLQAATFIYAFEAYDVRADSIIFRKVLIPGSGRLVLTPDNRYVFYTNPGNGLDGPSAAAGFSVYDVRANLGRDILDDTFFTFFYNGDTTLKMISRPTFLAVTPDSRWLVMMSGLFTAQAVFLWDIRAERPVHRWLGFPRQFYNLSVETGRLSRF